MVNVCELQGCFPPDEDRRVAALKAGSTAAWQDLHEEFHGKLQRYAWVRLRSATDATEVADATFSRAVDAIDRYENRDASLAAWLYGIARNLTQERHRLLQRRAVQSRDTLADLGELMNALAIEQTTHLDQRLDLIESFSKLTRDQQEVLTLVYVAGFSVREIAGMLGKTERAIFGIQARGLVRLRQIVS